MLWAKKPIVVSGFPKVRRNIFIIKCKLRNKNVSGHFHSKLTYFFFFGPDFYTDHWNKTKTEKNVFIISGFKNPRVFQLAFKRSKPRYQNKHFLPYLSDWWRVFKTPGLVCKSYKACNNVFGVMVYTFKLSMLKAEMCLSPWVQGRSGLHSNFLAM